MHDVAPSPSVPSSLFVILSTLTNPMASSDALENPYGTHFDDRIGYYDANFLLGYYGYEGRIHAAAIHVTNRH
jgi:hypothetical protein